MDREQLDKHSWGQGWKEVRIQIVFALSWMLHCSRTYKHNFRDSTNLNTKLPSYETVFTQFRSKAQTLTWVHLHLLPKMFWLFFWKVAIIHILMSFALKVNLYLHIFAGLVFFTMLPALSFLSSSIVLF